ncbi:MAG: hypothetical protein K6A41_02940 [Bacteroidales bacterium]|nr:hypothetical protein [Bacteroidales bacterium]
MKGYIRLLIIIILTASSLSAQTEGPLRVGHIVVDSLSLRIDTLSIVPETFHISNLSPSQYTLDPIISTLYLKDSSLLGKTLSFQYRTYKSDFSKPIAHKPISLIESPSSVYVVSSNMQNLYPEQQSDHQMLSSGSISRGVSVGNSQDLVLNSSLNLQLFGYLTDDLQLQAVISDKNVPIQPDGSTQNINNFNNVYIKLLYKDIAQVSAGDIELPKPKSYFLFATGNLLGMDGAVLTKAKDKYVISNSLGGGVAKGRFVRQTITPANGVQGPYKLTGAQGELGIVIIAGSERVYVDGKLLTRGQDHDYTIDYNTAELTFTPAMLMVAEKRVVVEFEYSDRNYARYALYSYNDLSISNKHFLHVNFYQAQDLKNQSIQPELTNDQKFFLSQLGDITSAGYRNDDTVAFSPDRVLYSRIDTLVNGELYENVFVYTTDPSVTHYSPAFSYVGAHKGSYRLLSSTTNGRIFEWVAPKGGQPQGDYDPVQLLTTPKLAQMLTIASKHQFTPRFSLQNEIALSHYDQNLFSKEDDKDNTGFAYHIGVKQIQPLQKKLPDSLAWCLQSEVEWQFVHKNFHAIESFRDVEFARNYNLSEDYSTLHSEQMLKAQLLLQKSSISSTQYTLNWFSRLHDVFALRQELFSSNHWKGLRFNTRTSFLNTRDSLQNTHYWTSNNQLSYSFEKVEIGVRHLLEHNLFHDALADTLRANSFAFNEIEAYVRNNVRLSDYLYQISYKNRLEWAPDTDLLRHHLSIHEAKASFAVHKWKNHHLALQGTYRYQQLQTVESSPEHYFVGSAEYTGRFFKRALVLQTYYEVGSGMEQQKVYTFLKVATGQGTHVWNDYNGNGIEELDEFELAAFQYEANYVKVYLTSNEYVNTYNNQLTQSVQFLPANLWNKPVGFKKFLSRFSDVMMFRSQLKDRKVEMNPFHNHMEDTNLIYRNVMFNNTFSFNNSSSKFAFDFVVRENRQKNLLYYGFEQTAISMQQLVLKSAPHPVLRLRAGYIHQVTDNASDAMSSRCYTLVHHEADGSITLQFNNAYSFTAAYQWQLKNEQNQSISMSAHKATLTADVRMKKFGVVTASIQYAHIKSGVEQNTSLAYVMLEGLTAGQNALWSLQYQLSLNAFLQLALQYEGRYSQGHRAVHTGNITVKAQF